MKKRQLSFVLALVFSLPPSDSRVIGIKGRRNVWSGRFHKGVGKEGIVNVWSGRYNKDGRKG